MTKGKISVDIVSGDVAAASFTNSGDVSADIKLDLYNHSKKNSILHGESTNGLLKFDADEINDSQYLIGIFNGKENKLRIIKNSKLFSGRVKSSKNLISDAKLIKTLKRKEIEGSYAERRNALGEEFGTKKAKKAINEASRNKINSESLEDSQIDIIDGIKQTTKNMPNREEMNKLVEIENRVIPPFNINAKNVEDIYSIEEIIPIEILSSFPINSFIDGNYSDEKIIEKINLLPYVNKEDNKSSIIFKLFKNILNETNLITDNLKFKLQLLSFTSMLIGLYFNRRVNRRDKLIESFKNIPPSRCINYMLQLFSKNNSNNNGNNKRSINFDREIRMFSIGPKEEDKILCHIIVFLLTLFDYRLDLTILASDLSLKPSKLLALVRTLGCQVLVGNKNDGSDSIGSKIAVLKVPFKAPEIVRRFRR